MLVDVDQGLYPVAEVALREDVLDVGPDRGLLDDQRGGDLPIGQTRGELVRTPRTLPRILAPAPVDALLAALRTWRDRAMVEAWCWRLRRCEVLGLWLADLDVAQRRVFIAEGTGGHQRMIPVSGRFFASVASYLDLERPAEADTDRLFVVRSVPHLRRGQRRCYRRVEAAPGRIPSNLPLFPACRQPWSPQIHMVASRSGGPQAGNLYERSRSPGEWCGPSPLQGPPTSWDCQATA